MEHYKRSKAKVIKYNQQKDNIYTQNETAARWYKVVLKSKKETNNLMFSKDTAVGGYQFTIYKKGQKKSVKTVKATKKLGWERIKLPKKTETYYIKISKLTKKTSGLYRIEPDDTSVGSVVYTY